MGAKAKTMIRSLIATWASVYGPSPSVRYDQTNTMAVQGAAARMIKPGDVVLGHDSGQSSATRTRKSHP